ncbi:uncharacterized protein LOC123274040 [Cotesia glomerata]|uniref:uncharacterized protein LOC123274040 n=1 Tax=Cotesia glomerata TaxID=32391 RepID=UPI001D029788|nr:uncharacterized protein LOC123274040 [Cotesia glomerata]
MAIMEALKLILKSSQRKFVIFSDSRSVLEALASNKYLGKKSYIILCIRDLILKLQEEGKEVRLHWIPVHVGISGNEWADQVAKRAAVTGKDSNLELPANDFKKRWKMKLKEDFNAWCLESAALKDARAIWMRRPRIIFFGFVLVL